MFYVFTTAVNASAAAERKPLQNTIIERKYQIMKKMMAIVIVALMCIQAIAMPTSALNTIPVVDQTQVIYDSFELINRGDWNNWSQCFASEVQKDYEKLVSKPENFINNIGILTVKTAEVQSIEKVSDGYTATVYPELQAYFADESAYDCYKVSVDIDVNENNGYFDNGINDYLITIVNDRGNWKIASITFCPPVLRNADTGVYSTNGSAYGHYTCGDEPTTINVKDEKGDIHENVDFTDFIINVTCNEIGNMGYCNDAIKANSMAAKMAGWYFILGGYYAPMGYDIEYQWVAYKSYLATTEANTQIVTDAVSEIDGYRLVTNVGKVFFTSYFDGNNDDTGYHTGRMRQNGSQYLAVTYNYDWEDILHYYDDSSYNANTSVGTVQITND